MATSTLPGLNKGGRALTKIRAGLSTGVRFGKAIVLVFCMCVGLLLFAVSLIDLAIVFLWHLGIFLRAPIGIKDYPTPDIVYYAGWFGAIAVWIAGGLFWITDKIAGGD